MFDIRIKVLGKTNEGLSIMSESRITCEDEAGVATDLGKFLYSVECMGYSFNTGEVYDKAMASFKEASVDSRYTVIYNEKADDLELNVATRQRVLV